jgi:biotin transport system substrate-specific component
VTTLNPSMGRPGSLADLIPGSGVLAYVRDAGLVIGGAALTGLAAQVSITVPSITPVPFTLQTFAVLLVGASLGSVRGLVSMALYVVVGLAGVPWFAEGSSGYPAATFGYLLGFIAAAALVGWLSERGDDRRYVSAVGEMVIGSAVIYAFGVTVLMANLNLNLATGLSEGMVPFVIGDGLKLLAAAGLLPLAWKLVNRDKKV